MTDKPQVPAQASPSVSLEAAAVAAYLEANPDFFVEHEELLPALRIPHQRGDTVSLVERQMKILRERNIEMRNRLSHLMDVARDNDRLFDKTRRLILTLMDATSLEETVIAVEDSLRQDFQVPFVSLILFSDNPMPVGRWDSGGEAQRASLGLHGVLAIASRDPAHFTGSVGTLYLDYRAEVLGRVLPPFTTALRAVR